MYFTETCVDICLTVIYYNLLYLWDVLPDAVDIINHPLQSRIGTDWFGDCVKTKGWRKRIKLLGYQCQYKYGTQSGDEHPFIDTYIIALKGHSSVAVWIDNPRICPNGIFLVVYPGQHPRWTVKRKKRHSDEIVEKKVSPTLFLIIWKEKKNRQTEKQF